MKPIHSRKASQGGFISGKLSFLLIFVALGFMVMNEMPGTKVMGKSAADLQVEMGQPVAKEQIPRPN